MDKESKIILEDLMHEELSNLFNRLNQYWALTSIKESLEFYANNNLDVSKYRKKYEEFSKKHQNFVSKSEIENEFKTQDIAFSIQPSMNNYSYIKKLEFQS